MNLDEIREIVDFMKENGLSELEYSEKNTSIRLKLASSIPAPESSSAAEPEETEDVPEAIVPDEVKKAAAEAAAVTAEEVKKAAAKAAAIVGESIKAGATGVADYIKTKRDEKSAPYEVTLEDSEEPEPFIDDEPVEVLDEDPNFESQDSVKLDTASAKTAVKKTGEVLANTAKAGFTLGKAGLRRGKTFLMDRIKPKSAGKSQPEEIVPEENESEE